MLVKRKIRKRFTFTPKQKGDSEMIETNEDNQNKNSLEELKLMEKQAALLASKTAADSTEKT